MFNEDSNKSSNTDGTKDYSFKLKGEFKKSKYPFDTAMVGFGFEIPEGTSIQTMRVTVSKWHADNKATGKRFKVFADVGAVVRVA